MSHLLRALSTASAIATSAGPAAARVASERFDQPMPLGTFTAGLVIVAVATIAIAVLFAVAKAPTGSERRVNPPDSLCPLAHSVRGYGVAVFLLVIAAGLFGHEHPARNIAPAMVWVGWWIGFSFLCCLVADLWPLLNPWRTIYVVAEFIRYRLTSKPERPRRYPAQLAEWPAVALLFVFLWIEIASPFGSKPFALAVAILIYSAITFVGMAVYGRETWLHRGEAFTLVFSIIGRFAPLRIGTAQRKAGYIVVRPWGTGLLEQEGPSAAIVAFVLLMLSAVLFDGLLGTGLWRAAEPWLPTDQTVTATIGLLATWIVFLGAYLIACRVMSLATGRSNSAFSFARAYLFTLVPIAIGYDLAYNTSYLLIQGQEILRLISDPFGLDWNLFGTATRQPKLDVIDARTTWHVAIGAIVGGHIIAVWLAHVIALRTLPTRRLAVVSLAPLTVLMVIYTGASLAILAEPIARFGSSGSNYTRVLQQQDQMNTATSPSGFLVMRGT